MDSSTGYDQTMGQKRISFFSSLFISGRQTEDVCAATMESKFLFSFFHGVILLCHILRLQKKEKLLTGDVRLLAW